MEHKPVFAEKVSIPRFKDERLKSGVSRVDMVPKCQVSYATLCRIENGGGVKLSTARRVARAIGKTVEELQ